MKIKKIDFDFFVQSRFECKFVKNNEILEKLI